MNKTAVVRVGASLILLVASAVGASLHARDSASPVQAAFETSRSAGADEDLVGVLGDVLIDGCSNGEARCSKAWQDLGKLAGESRL